MEVKPRNLTSNITTNVGLQINGLPGSQRSLRVRYTDPPARNPFLREKPFLLLLTWTCSHHGRFSISSPVCHCCLQQQREDWQPLQNMTNMRQPEWDAYSPRALTSHAPSHAFWPIPKPLAPGRGCRVSDPPHRLPSQSKQTAGWRDRKGDKHHIHVNTCTCILRLRRTKHGGGMEVIWLNFGFYSVP